MSGTALSRTFLPVLAAVLLSVSVTHADKKEGTTVIVKCVYGTPSGFATRVAGVEFAGPRDPEVVVGTSYAQAFNVLMDAGFTLVHAGKIPATGSGTVDAADYVVWRKTY